jgi:hypothetical protein
MQMRLLLSHIRTWDLRYCCGKYLSVCEQKGNAIHPCLESLWMSWTQRVQPRITWKVVEFCKWKRVQLIITWKVFEFCKWKRVQPIITFHVHVCMSLCVWCLLVCVRVCVCLALSILIQWAEKKNQIFKLLHVEIEKIQQIPVHGSSK